VRLFAVRQPSQEPSDAAPLLVLLHGLAADEQDLIGLVSELDPRLKAISLRAPFQTGYGGYAWFGLEPLPDGGWIIEEEQAESSLEILLGDLAELRAQAGSKLIVGGFSQGAMMAASALLARPDLIDAAWLMSGRYLPFLDREPEQSPSRPVLVQHGTYDELVAVEEGREFCEVLRAHGHDVRYQEYAMGHQIGYESLRDADEWLLGLMV